ncbi:MAG TPA: M50 family metallopeptidase [Herpetosiphonaceae bacterium]|nr:M50 family metallopeptidase [Herpetosiphonaceae bacterium]
MASDEGSFLRGWRHREVLMALGMGILCVVLWRLPAFAWLLYPFRLLNTFAHELSHGIAAIATGGEFLRFTVRSDLSGLAWSAGGVRWVVTSAGYIGSALVGGVLTILSARGIAARTVLVGLGIALGVLCLLFVRNIFGVAAGLLLAGALFLAGRWLNRFWADGLLLFLSVQLMLDAFDSLLDLVVLSTAAPDARTDAQSMAAMTGIPAIVWAVLWNMVALAILAGSLYLAYRKPPEGIAAEQARPARSGGHAGSP